MTMKIQIQRHYEHTITMKIQILCLSIHPISQSLTFIFQVSLTCEVDSNPPPTYTWTKGDSRQVYNQKTKKKQIKDKDKDNHKTPTCLQHTHGQRDIHFRYLYS